MTHARICVYMNISQSLPKLIDLNYKGKIWSQPLEHEHVLFKCFYCHKHFHLFLDCPMRKEEIQEEGQQRVGDGFMRVPFHHRNLKGQRSEVKENPLNNENVFSSLENMEE